MSSDIPNAKRGVPTLLIHLDLYIVGGDGFEPPKASPADLQSAPFGHSGNHPTAFVLKASAKVSIIFETTASLVVFFHKTDKIDVFGRQSRRRTLAYIQGRMFSPCASKAKLFNNDLKNL